MIYVFEMYGQLLVLEPDMCVAICPLGAFCLATYSQPQLPIFSSFKYPWSDSYGI